MKKNFWILGMSIITMLSFSSHAYAGEWKKDNTGWWYQESNGTYPTKQWSNISGKWYYFDENGYMVHDRWIGDYYLGTDGSMLTSTVTPDGYQVDASGKWIPTIQAKNVFDSFIYNKEYAKYTSGWNESPCKYTYLDIDEDGNQELILLSDGEFFHALICSADLQSGAIKILDNGYYFGSLRYSEIYRALVLTEFRVSYMMADYNFMGINASELVPKFYLGWDATGGNRIYYKNNSEISEQEFSTYFDTLVEPAYIEL